MSAQTQILKKWRYTWETQSHIPTLRLFLFNPNIKPSDHCKNLKVSLILEQSLLICWNEVETEHQTDESEDCLLKVPIPRVLVDVGSPVAFKAMEDHIEVKLVLLLPVDHPLNVNIGSVLDVESDRENDAVDQLQPVSVDSDLKCLSSQNGVDLFCKNCSLKLTRRPLRSFVEMPSADWREVADNWFGSCCCSFGGISEKLVKRYINSYVFAQGTCLLDTTSVIVSKDDLAENVVPDCFRQSKEKDPGYDVVGENDLHESLIDSGSNGRQSFYSGYQCGKKSNVNEELSSMPIKKERVTGNMEGKETEKQDYADTSYSISSTVTELSANVVPVREFCTNFQSHCCLDNTNKVPSHDHEGCSHEVPVTSSDALRLTQTMKPLKDHESLLNVSLGSGFMVRTSNLSKKVDWVELQCIQCSSAFGAYPSASDDGHAPLDGGIRFFKCDTSTSLPVSGSGNIFRKYSLQRMFANQLMESAKDELSFRTVVRDLRSRSPMLQIVLLNSDVWCCTGYCLETEDAALSPASKIDMRPVAKVLYSDCSDATEAQLRMLEKWTARNQVDEIYMLSYQIKKLIDSLELAKGGLPFSSSFMQGLSLSSIER